MAALVAAAVDVVAVDDDPDEATGVAASSVVVDDRSSLNTKDLFSASAISCCNIVAAWPDCNLVIGDGLAVLDGGGWKKIYKHYLTIVAKELNRTQLLSYELESEPKPKSISCVVTG